MTQELKVGQIRKCNNGDEEFKILFVGKKQVVYSYSNEEKEERSNEIDDILKNSTEVKEKEIWYQVFYKRSWEEYGVLTNHIYKTKDEFLTDYSQKESDFEWIELKPVIER